MNSISQKQPLEVAKNLKAYQESGVVKYDSLLSIPFGDRIPGLLKKSGEKQVHAIITVMLTEFCNFFNVIRPMTNEQIVACAYELIITSEEDQLSIEDLSIFFHGARQGKYGKPVFDHLDQQVIFMMLEDYREQRHRKCIQIRDEQQAQYVDSDPIPRASEDGDQSIKNAFRKANYDRFTDTAKYGIQEDDL